MNSAVRNQLQVRGNGHIDCLSAETEVCLDEFSFQHVLLCFLGGFVLSIAQWNEVE